MSMMANELKHAPVISMLAEPNLEQARQFWRDRLGLEEIAYNPQEGAYYRAGQGSWFGIYQHEGGSKCDHTQVAFMIQDLEGTMQSLRQQGVVFEDYDLPYLKTMNGVATLSDGSRGAWFKDPGGNIIGVMVPSPQRSQALQGGMAMAGAGAGTGTMTGGGMGGGMGGGR